MDEPDAQSIGQQAVRLGLITPAQLQEAWEEGAEPRGPAEPLLQALERKGYLTPLQSSKLLKGDTVGYFLGGYRLLYKIASGTFGRVYRGDDPRSGRVVAIKVLRQKWSEDKRVVELFEREGKVGLSLRHPNIVEVLDVNRDPRSGQYYIVMEFVEGGNLRELLRIRQKLEPVEVLRILEDAAQGLTYAFSQGITHRDIKLTNILLSSQGMAKLVDFGLAGMQTLFHLGDDKVDRTVDYAGLELATGVPAGDPRSDIYFLGCVAYELLSGRPPLEPVKDKRRRMLRERFLSVPPLRPEDVPGGPPSLLHLVETMMSLNPQQRFQTPAQLLEAVRDVRHQLESRNTPRDAPRAVFLVERDERLQDLMREKLKELGYRVYLSGDPARALDRFRQQPFHALVVDVRTVGEEGLLVGEQLLREAERKQLPCAGIFLLSAKQEKDQRRITPRSTVAVLLDQEVPGGRVTIKQLHRKLRELLQRALEPGATNPPPAKEGEKRETSSPPLVSEEG
jgi:serine/threonine protein kinase